MERAMVAFTNIACKMKTPLLTDIEPRSIRPILEQISKYKGRATRLKCFPVTGGLNVKQSGIVQFDGKDFS
jgi:hypothetical protein